MKILSWYFKSKRKKKYYYVSTGMLYAKNLCFCISIFAFRKNKFYFKFGFVFTTSCLIQEPICDGGRQLNLSISTNGALEECGLYAVVTTNQERLNERKQVMTDSLVTGCPWQGQDRWILTLSWKSTQMYVGSESWPLLSYPIRGTAAQIGKIWLPDPIKSVRTDVQEKARFGEPGSAFHHVDNLVLVCHWPPKHRLKVMICQASAFYYVPNKHFKYIWSLHMAFLVKQCWLPGTGNIVQECLQGTSNDGSRNDLSPLEHLLNMDMNIYNLWSYYSKL